MEATETDASNLVNSGDGYVSLNLSPSMNTDNLDEHTLMDAGHHFKDVPRGTRRRWELSGDTAASECALPRDLFHLHVIDNHKVHPHANHRNRKETLYDGKYNF